MASLMALVLKTWLIISFITIDILEVSSSQLPEWTNEVFTGDHLDELVVESNGYFTNNVVLVIYGRKCQSKLRLLNINIKSLPPSNFLLFCKYNYDKANKDMWLEMDEELDLKKRYGSKECLDVLMFKRGLRKDKEPLRWEPGPNENFQEWVWKNLGVQVTISNKLPSPIAVYFEGLSGDSPELPPVYFPPGTAQMINTYPAYVAMIYATEAIGSEMKDPNNKFIEARVVRINSKIAVSSVPSKPKYSGQTFLEVIREKQDKEIEKYTKFLTAHAQRSLLNVRQPPFLSTLSKQGYQIVQYSKELQGKLVAYFQQFSEKLNEEVVCNQYGVIINADKQEHYCDSIKINKKLQIDIVKETNKIASDFCNCAVKLVAINNITVHRPSSVVHRHLKKPDRAAITVVVQILKDMNKYTEPWITEITNLEGNKVNIDLNMREALVYESAQCIMGRPNPLKGYAQVEFTVEYVPYRSWPFAHDTIVKYISEGLMKGIRRKYWKEKQDEQAETNEATDDKPGEEMDGKSQSLKDESVSKKEGDNATGDQELPVKTDSSNEAENAKVEDKHAESSKSKHDAIKPKVINKDKDERTVQRDTSSLAKDEL